MNRALCFARALNFTCKRYSSSGKLPPDLIVPLNKEMIVCWHPEQEFPYECSQPLPEEKQPVSNSILCVGRKEIADVFYKKRREEVIEELAKISYTTKHRWYPKGKKARRMRTTEAERKYL